MSKKTTSFSMDKAISRISKPSVFDRIVKEIDAKEIPAKYIEQIIVQYYDGSIVEMSGTEITYPIPINRNTQHDKMEDIKVFISTDRLEEDVNEMVEQYLGTYC